MQDILVPLSPGELLDKITILRIKSERIEDAAEARQRAPGARSARAHLEGIRLPRRSMCRPRSARCRT